MKITQQIQNKTQEQMNGDQNVLVQTDWYDPSLLISFLVTCGSTIALKKKVVSNINCIDL